MLFFTLCLYIRNHMKLNIPPYSFVNNKLCISYQIIRKIKFVSCRVPICNEFALVKWQIFVAWLSVKPMLTRYYRHRKSLPMFPRESLPICPTSKKYSLWKMSLKFVNWYVFICISNVRFMSYEYELLLNLKVDI